MAAGRRTTHAGATPQRRAAKAPTTPRQRLQRKLFGTPRRLLVPSPPVSPEEAPGAAAATQPKPELTANELEAARELKAAMVRVGRLDIALGRAQAQGAAAQAAGALERAAGAALEAGRPAALTGRCFLKAKALEHAAGLFEPPHLGAAAAGHAELAQRLRSNSKDFFDFKAADNLLTAGKRAPTPEPEPESQPEPEAEPDVFGPALGKWKIEEEEVHVVTENERVWSTVASLQRTSADTSSIAAELAAMDEKAADAKLKAHLEQASAGFAGMKAAALRKELEKRGLPPKGKKAELLRRLASSAEEDYAEQQKKAAARLRTHQYHAPANADNDWTQAEDEELERMVRAEVEEGEEVRGWSEKAQRFSTDRTAIALRKRWNWLAPAVERAAVGPDGLVRQHCARPSGRPVDAGDSGRGRGVALSRELNDLAVMAVTKAKAAAAGIAPGDEFELRAPNLLDRLPVLVAALNAANERVEARAGLRELLRQRKEALRDSRRALDRAVEGVTRMAKADLEGLRAYRVPPEAVRKTLEAVVSLLSGANVGNMPYTALLQAFEHHGCAANDGLLTSIRLAETLRVFDVCSTTDVAVRSVKLHYVEDDRWNVANVRRAAEAMAPLCVWIHAQIKVHMQHELVEEILIDEEAEAREILAAERVQQQVDWIMGKAGAVEEAIGLLSTALGELVGVGSGEGEAARKRLLLWRSQLLGMTAKPQIAVADNALLARASEVGKADDDGSTRKRLANRQLLTHVRLLEETEGDASLAHAHDCAMSVLADMRNKKITPEEVDNTERAFSTVMGTFSREREFWALKCPHAEPLDLPERVSTDKDAARTSRRLAAKRARQAAKRRKNDKARRGFLAAGRGVVGAVALRRQQAMRQTDAAILAMRKIRALLEGQWHNARWQPADFMDIRMPLSRVRTSLDKALSFSRDRQKMKPQDMLSVQVALRNSGVEPDALKVLMRGLAQGALLDKEMLSAIEDARPPLPGEDLAKLLKVIAEHKKVIMDAFLHIVAPAAIGRRRAVTADDLLMGHEQWCLCIETAGGLDGYIDAVVLERIFVQALGLQAVKKTGGKYTPKELENEQTSASRRKLNAEKGEMSLLGFVAGVIRVAAFKNPQLPSLHERLSLFLEQNLVLTRLGLHAFAPGEDEMSVAARQPVVLAVLERHAEPLQCCFRNFVPEDARQRPIDEIGLELAHWLRLCEDMFWLDERFTRSTATRLFIEATRPHGDSKPSSPGDASEEGLELEYRPFLQQVVRVAFLKKSDGDASLEVGTETFEGSVAQCTDAFINTALVPVWKDGRLSGGSGAVSVDGRTVGGSSGISPNNMAASSVGIADAKSDRDEEEDPLPLSRERSSALEKLWKEQAEADEAEALAAKEQADVVEAEKALEAAIRSGDAAAIKAARETLEREVAEADAAVAAAAKERREAVEAAEALQQLDEQERAVAAEIEAAAARPLAQLVAADGRLCPRQPPTPRWRRCAECGDKFVLPTGRTHSGARGRVVPNRDLCDTHRPRLCKYSKEIYPNSAVCGRIFTLLDNACRTGGTCCE